MAIELDLVAVMLMLYLLKSVQQNQTTVFIKAMAKYFQLHLKIKRCIDFDKMSRYHMMWLSCMIRFLMNVENKIKTIGPANKTI